MEFPDVVSESSKNWNNSDIASSFRNFSTNEKPSIWFRFQNDADKDDKDDRHLQDDGLLNLRNFLTNKITYHFPHAHAWCWGDISACPPACPLLYTIRAHSIPYLAIQYHTRHGAAPLHTSTSIRAPAAGATRLHAGTTIHTIIGQYYKALGPMRGPPESNGPRASPPLPS